LDLGRRLAVRARHRRSSGAEPDAKGKPEPVREDVQKYAVGGLVTLLTAGILGMFSMKTMLTIHEEKIEGLRRDMARLEAGFRWTHGEPSAAQVKVESDAVAKVEDMK